MAVVCFVLLCEKRALISVRLAGVLLEGLCWLTDTPAFHLISWSTVLALIQWQVVISLQGGNTWPTLLIPTLVTLGCYSVLLSRSLLLPDHVFPAWTATRHQLCPAPSLQKHQTQLLNLVWFAVNTCDTRISNWQVPENGMVSRQHQWHSQPGFGLKISRYLHAKC